MSYSTTKRSDAINVDATTPAKLFSNPSPFRTGWRVTIPPMLSPGVGLLFFVQPKGNDAPTKSQVVSGPSGRAEASAVVEDQATGYCDVYVVLESGPAISLVGEELF